MPIKIYCDTNAFREELHKLQRKGVIDLIIFPYDNKTEKKINVASPSAATWEDCHTTWARIGHFRWSDFSGSDKYEDIRRILGRPRRDALHLDSAFKSGCTAFLTRDKRHILAKAKELEELLGMRFFHPDEQWNDFLHFLDTNI